MKTLIEELGNKDFSSEISNKQFADFSLESEKLNFFSKYKEEYINRLKANRVMKIVLFYFSIAMLTSLVFAFVFCLIRVAVTKQSVSSALSIIIPACVSISVDIIAIVKIIATHLFPQDEEKHLVEIIGVLTSKIKDKENKI